MTTRTIRIFQAPIKTRRANTDWAGVDIRAEVEINPADWHRLVRSYRSSRYYRTAKNPDGTRMEAYPQHVARRILLATLEPSPATQHRMWYARRETQAA